MSKLTLIMGVVILLLLAALGTEYQRAEKYKERAKASADQVAALSITLTSKDGVIGQFEAAAKEAQAIVADQKKALDKAAGRVQTLRSQLAESRKQLQLLEEADHDIPACDSLLNTPITVCPGFLRGMHERASSLQRSDSGSTVASADAGGPSSNGRLPTEVRPSTETDR
jgi:hypothetical protein